MKAGWLGRRSRVVRPTDRFRRDPELVWRLLEDELVIVRPSDGQIRVLNNVGAFIWQALNGECSLAQLVGQICAEYEVSVEEAGEDLIALLQELVDEGLVGLVGSTCEE